MSQYYDGWDWYDSFFDSPDCTVKEPPKTESIEERNRVVRNIQTYNQELAIKKGERERERARIEREEKERIKRDNERKEMEKRREITLHQEKQKRIQHQQLYRSCSGQIRKDIESVLKTEGIISTFTIISRGSDSDILEVYREVCESLGYSHICFQYESNKNLLKVTGSRIVHPERKIYHL